MEAFRLNDRIRQNVTKYFLTDDTGTIMKQSTIQQVISLSGVGLHSGQTVHMRFLPSVADTGIVFVRSDLENPMPIHADYRLIQDAMMSSNLTNEYQQRVGTVEHLMSAIAGLGIDNLQIEVSASEIPIMDGSALPFIQALQQAGIQYLEQDKKFIQILRPVRVEQDDKFASVSPYHGFSLDFQIDFAHPAFQAGQQHIKIDFSTNSFIQQIASARTFGFIKDIDYLKSQNLALGGSMENAIVLDDKQILNPEGLRFANEFVCHKVLDAVGDLYLAGHQILGAFQAYKSGHALNNQLLRAVLADENNFKIVTFCDKNPPIIY